jgi:hypothetical protein
MRKFLFGLAFILAGLLFLGIAVGCDEDGREVDIDSGTGGEGIAPPIPNDHGETDCKNDICHGSEGELPIPDDGDHLNIFEEDCGSCHF